MAKTKKKKVVKKAVPLVFNPQKYVIEAARKLPILSCLVNEGWDEMGMAVVIITRVRPKGTYVIGTYIVDTFCLGVKDTGWWCDVDAEHLENLQNGMQLDFTEIEKDVALNIIYGGIRYAKQFDFQPHKDFTAVTQYILDPFSSVEDLELTFGKDGKPCYVQGPHDKPLSITQKLERKVGKDGFQVISQFHGNMNDLGLIGGEDDEDEYETDDDEDYADYEEIKN
jgi:hypothetical protein